MHVLIPALHRPTKPTGVCRHAVNLAQCLAEATHVNQVTLLIGEWQKDYFETSFDLTSSKIQTFVINIANTSRSRNLWFLFGLPKVALQLNPDVIHMSFPFPFIRYWFKVPLISTIHDLYPYEYPENFGHPQVWFNQLFLRQCVHSSDGLTCVSRTTLNSLNQYFPAQKELQARTIIYNYVNLNSDNLKPPAEKAFPPSGFILCVAQHRKNKNLDLLIQAYAQLLKAKREDLSKLILVGSLGPETNNLKALVKKFSLQKNVLFFSALSDQELGWLYKNCQLFAMPSSTEGFCLPLVEALSFGARVVCSDIPIFREVTSDNCQYFSLEGDPLVNLVTAAKEALTSKSLEFQPSVKKDFSKETVSQKLTDFYALVKTKHRNSKPR